MHKNETGKIKKQNQSGTKIINFFVIKANP